MTIVISDTRFPKRDCLYESSCILSSTSLRVSPGHLPTLNGVHGGTQTLRGTSLNIDVEVLGLTTLERLNVSHYIPYTKRMDLYYLIILLFFSTISSKVSFFSFSGISHDFKESIHECQYGWSKGST